jgi:hypothetical protein
MKKLSIVLFSFLFIGITSLNAQATNEEKVEDKTENSAHGETDHTCDATLEGCDGYLSPLEKDIKEFADCVCKMGRIIQEMSDSDNLEGLNLQLEEQSEKCQKMDKEFEEKYKDDKEAAKEGESLMKKEMEDCEYL